MPPSTREAENHSEVLAVVRPPVGSEVTMKTPKPAQVMTADHQAAPETRWWNQSRRMRRAKTSSATMSGWTMERSPMCRAMA